MPGNERRSSVICTQAKKNIKGEFAVETWKKTREETLYCLFADSHSDSDDSCCIFNAPPTICDKSEWRRSGGRRV